MVNLVDYLVFLALFVSLPFYGVFLGATVCFLHSGHGHTDKVPKRIHNIVAEAGLLLRDDCLSPVAKERSWQVLALLHIALDEELLEKQVSPLLQAVEVPSRGAQIARVDQKVQILLLAREFFFLRPHLNDRVAVVPFPSDVLVLDPVVDYVDLAHVVSHVGCKDHSDDPLAQNFLLVVPEALREVELRTQQHLHRL